MGADMVTLVMALFYLAAGVICVQKPHGLARLIYAFFHNARGQGMLSANWQASTKVVVAIRLFGLLSLLNFAMQVYLLTGSAAPAS